MRKYLSIIILALIIGGLIYIYPNFEWSAPVVDIKLESDKVGVKPFNIEIRDKGKGLKSVSVVLAHEKGETVLVDKTYPEGIKGDNLEITLDPKESGIKGGPSVLRVTAVDGSKFNFLSGNKTRVTKNITLDLTPPKVDVISTEHYVNHGGSGLVVYKASEDTIKSGIQVGDYFFPGYKGYFPDENVYLGFFAYPYDLEQGAKIAIVAQDGTGNAKTKGLFYRIRDINYRKSDIKISEWFIDNVIVPLAGDSAGADNKELFLEVNNKLRKENDKKIREVGTNTKDELRWQGAFSQLSNSQVEANFADERTYIYKEEPIDKQYHLGYDLAVTKRYPIEAANNGVVVYADELGIYGNTVILDHGMGIATLYGHMSSIDVSVGDEVKKKDIMGRTGQTGLAAGDHLHYGVYINGVAVRPVEWWDGKWIKDNIINKIENAQAEFGDQGGEGSQSEN